MNEACHIERRAMLAPESDGQQSLPFRLTGSQAKTAFALRQNVEALIAGNASRKLVEWGEGEQKFRCYKAEPENLHCTGFLTLTVGDTVKWTDVRKRRVRQKFVQVWDAAEASRRINNLNKVLHALFDRAVVVTERHANGAIHFHLVGTLADRADIRTGFNWKQVAEKDYSSASRRIREIWAWLRKTLPKYGFGRAELMPIRTSAEAVACYVSKYIEKNLFNRCDADKRKKLVRYLGWEKSQLRPNDFSWGTKAACAWRQKARQLAGLVGITDRAEVAETFGPRWAFFFHRIMQGQTGENPLNPCPALPFFIWDFAERERVKREVVKLAERACMDKEAEKNFSAYLRHSECDAKEPGFRAPGRSRLMQAIRDFEFRQWRKENTPEQKAAVGISALTFEEARELKWKSKRAEARRASMRELKKFFPAPPVLSVARGLPVEVVSNQRPGFWNSEIPESVPVNRNSIKKI